MKARQERVARPPSAAADSARQEAHFWAEVAGEWAHRRHPALWDDVAPTEEAVVRFFDPAPDLDKRGDAWGHTFTTHDLAGVASFAAGLAEAEADAWEAGNGVVATRAFEDRRFLLGDRTLHWAVPWLDAVGRCYPHLGDRAQAHEVRLLLLADEQRPAPLLTGTEGTVPPGYDSFGPLQAEVEGFKLSLWSGALLLRSTVRSLLGDPNAQREDIASGSLASDLAALYEVAAMRWHGMAADHPGSARLWTDLAERAMTSSRTFA